MTLRVQLLAFGLLTLVLPWAGWRYVQELEAALRAGFEQALVASAGTVAAALGERIEASPDSAAAGAPAVTPAAALPAAGAAAPGSGALYGHSLAAAPAIDGFRNDWSTPEASGNALDGGHRVWVGIAGGDAYVFVAVRDEDVVYQASPGATPHGDRVLLAVEAPGAAGTGQAPGVRPAPGGDPDRAAPEAGPRWLLLVTRAPGQFRAQWTGPPDFAPRGAYQDTVVSAWQERPDGYGVEVRIPLRLVGSRLGIGVVDVDPDGSGYAVSTSTSWPAARGAPGPLVRRVPDLDAFVARFARGGERYRVLDRDGWIVADAGALGPPPGTRAPPAPGLAEGFFRFALGRDDPPYAGLESPPGRIADPRLEPALEGRGVTAWYGSGPELGAVVAAAVPIESASGVRGAVLLEQASAPILTVTNRALVRLVALTLLASLAAALGLLGYATVLSFRVRRLARAAETALGPKGEIDARVPGRGARDELGDLARSFADLLTRLRDYTGYLRSLTSKLSHELRTPVAIVTTSLDNLRHEIATPDGEAYMRRLREGAQRLDAILAAMSEATRIEQAIGAAEMTVFSLDGLLRSCCEAYVDIYPERRIVYRGAGEAPMHGSRELVAQLMDKLIDNAVSFSPPDSRIEVELEERQERRAELVLRVANRGPALPESMRRQIFDSLVSVRGESGGRVHLGLGLYIVALIVEVHGGRVEADNLPDGGGAVFTVAFPRART